MLEWIYLQRIIDVASAVAWVPGTDENDDSELGKQDHKENYS